MRRIQTGVINFGPARGVLGQPKPRKRLEDEPFIDFLKAMPCIYQIDKFCRKANQPHHDRTGYGDGKGATSTRPDDYRAMRTDYVCHNSLHAMKGPRYRAMTEKIRRADILEDQINNLMKWGKLQGWALDQIDEITEIMWGEIKNPKLGLSEIYQVILDTIIDWIAREKP